MSCEYSKKYDVSVLQSDPHNIHGRGRHETNYFAVPTRKFIDKISRANIPKLQFAFDGTEQDLIKIGAGMSQGADSEKTLTKVNLPAQFYM
ncbi:hypothetical protein Zmor_016462 [Zophobas morio]|jgi:hypothetical protein|uniref:Uncharacterized protein n=1 Tax=Zophobas morio TaxID=2755281 RepID=A0AA38HLD7_9CUCU|nr:hypothetical protein Zmor_016462 [Zophobas morio]